MICKTCETPLNMVTATFGTCPKCDHEAVERELAGYKPEDVSDGKIDAPLENVITEKIFAWESPIYIAGGRLPDTTDAYWCLPKRPLLNGHRIKVRFARRDMISEKSPDYYYVRSGAPVQVVP